MAPINARQRDYDDYVLTLSDDDGTVDAEQLSGSKSDSKKRKRKDEGPAAVNGTVKSKKQKKDTKKQSNASFEYEEPGESEDDGSESDESAINSDFDFGGVDGDLGTLEEFDVWDVKVNGTGSKADAQSGQSRGLSLDEIISRRRDKATVQEPETFTEEVATDDSEDHVQAALQDDDEGLGEDGFGMGVDEEEDDSEAGSSEDIEEDSDTGSEAAPEPHPDDMMSDNGDHSSGDERPEDPREAAKRKAFFAPEDEEVPKTKGKASKQTGLQSFQSMSLSRPLLRGLAAVSFSEPTPIQKKTIPVALLGKDVVGGAVTGSGKTAAFLVPIFERLLYRPKKIPTSRVAILMPTRELAVQCLNVAQRLATYTDITFCKLVGGFSLREQESQLRQRPDVIIATPGRFIDHMRNSASFTVDTLEILVLDEADRMLEDGFADELNEILTTIPKSRQTMLFSATMTDSVDKLIRVGMTRPVRLLVDAKRQTVGTLVQEFVRLRPGREDKRLAYLVLLCKTIYTDRVIVFFRQKKETHRVRVMFGLCGLKAVELHGSMSQEQRVHAIESFRSGSAAFLLATDLAARGLDIKNVSSVVNYEGPQSHEIYLHRVGRTARAGRSGRACTLAAETDRKVVKAAVRTAKAQGVKVASRVIDVAEADEWAKKLEGMQDDLEAVLREEKEERALQLAEREVRKGENIVKHEDEIASRPRRTWFESEKQKRDAKQRGRQELNDPKAANGEGVLKRKTKGKLSGKEKKRLETRDSRRDGAKTWKKGKNVEQPIPQKKGKKIPGKGKKGKSR